MADRTRGLRPTGESEFRGPLARFSLTARILIVNILPLALLSGGLFYLDTYRTQLVTERFKLARIEAQITAEALVRTLAPFVRFRL